MQITHLIQKLFELHHKVGDVDVEARNTAGEFDVVVALELVNVTRQTGETKWRVFIDV